MAISTASFADVPFPIARLSIFVLKTSLSINMVSENIKLSHRVLTSNRWIAGEVARLSGPHPGGPCSLGSPTLRLLKGPRGSAVTRRAAALSKGCWDCFSLFTCRCLSISLSLAWDLLGFLLTASGLWIWALVFLLTLVRLHRRDLECGVEAEVRGSSPEGRHRDRKGPFPSGWESVHYWIQSGRWKKKYVFK